MIFEFDSPNDASTFLSLALKGNPHGGLNVALAGSSFAVAKASMEGFLTDADTTRVRFEEDRVYAHVGGHKVTALGVDEGSRVRGQRADWIVFVDRGTVPQDVYENIVSSHAVVSSSPYQLMKGRP